MSGFINHTVGKSFVIADYSKSSKSAARNIRKLRSPLRWNGPRRLHPSGARRYASGLIAVRVVDLLLAYHLRNHSRGIAVVRVEFE